MRRRIALEGVTISAQPGKVTALVGPNGSGKTTLLRLVLGFLRPTAGVVRVCGIEPDDYRRRHGMAYLPEEVQVPGGWSVRAFFERGAELAGIDAEGRDAAVRLAWDRSGLDDRSLGQLRLGTLSKGMQRRAVLAFALIGEPDVVVLDEPSSGLDPEARARLRSQVSQLAHAGRTVILSSHDLAEIERVADRIIVLETGRVVRVMDGSRLRSSAVLRVTLRGPQSVIASLAASGHIRSAVDGRFEVTGAQSFDEVARAVYEANGSILDVELPPASELERVLFRRDRDA